VCVRECVSLCICVYVYECVCVCVCVCESVYLEYSVFLPTMDDLSPRDRKRMVCKA